MTSSSTIKWIEGIFILLVIPKSDLFDWWVYECGVCVTVTHFVYRRIVSCARLHICCKHLYSSFHMHCAFICLYRIPTDIWVYFDQLRASTINDRLEVVCSYTSTFNNEFAALLCNEATMHSIFLFNAINYRRHHDSLSLCFFFSFFWIRFFFGGDFDGNIFT